MSAEPVDRKRKWDDPGSASDSPAAKAPRNDQLSPGAFEAASAAAARIAASIAPSRPSAPPQPKPSNEDGLYVKDIEIHDSRNRYLLTKGATQHQIQDASGASVTTKGQWYPDKSMATEKDPPLYLHITAPTQQQLDNAVARVHELMTQELGPLTEVRGRRAEEFRERRPLSEDKLYIGLEPLRNFNVRAKVVGPQGLFVKYIQSETGARVQIKGQGSGFTEVETGRESDDPMHVWISARDPGGCERAKTLAKDLLVVVKEEWEKAKKTMDQWHAEQHRNQQALVAAQQAQYGGAYAGYGQQPPLPSGDAPPLPPGQSAPPAPGADGQAGQAQSTDWQTLEQYANYYQSQASDPTYGSYYQAYAQYYSGLAQQYKAAAQNGATGQGTPNGAGAPPPPPPAPPAGGAPPPPPPA